MHDKIIEAKDISVSFKDKNNVVKNVLNGVSIDVLRNEAVGIVGTSGCGKTTLSRVLAGLLVPTSGSLIYNGVEVSSLSKASYKAYRNSVQMVFQDTLGALNPRMKMYDVLREVLIVHFKNTYKSESCLDNRIRELMNLVELPESLLPKYPHEMSGGQRQRIGIARALALKPSVLIADEPVSALDVSVQAQIIKMLDNIRKQEEMSLIFVSHDLAVVNCLCDRVVILNNGIIEEQGLCKNVFSNPQSLYTQELLSSIPRV